MSRTAVPVQGYVSCLRDLGYTFRLNECGDIVELADGTPVDDFIEATILARMRAEGFGPEAVREVIKMQAHQNRYHPIRAYLTQQGMAWDGVPRIGQLASYFTDETQPYPMFATWLRKWLIGAVAKAHAGDRHQNAMLVLDGPQGVGKSHWAKWLCSPLERYFVEGSIDPDSKDHQIRLISNWIWEVSELGATTRRADLEALKAFISARVVTVRRPYARMDMTRPALASFIGTVNNSSGVLSDPTGNRRFFVSRITALDWSYTKTIRPGDIWAEAASAYLTGESWYASADERARSEENNDAYRTPNPLAGYLTRFFCVDPARTDKWTSTAEIVDRLQTVGYRSASSRSLSMELAQTMTELGMEKAKRGPEKSRSWGYLGIWEDKLLP